jgi:hypothetical protein
VALWLAWLLGWLQAGQPLDAGPRLWDALEGAHGLAAGYGQGQQVTTTTTLVLLALGALVAAAVVWVYLRLRAPQEERFYHFHCPGCRGRLRYRKAQEGHAGKCSRCGHSFIFPPVSQAID